MAAEFLESRLLATAGFRHAFFTRHGGVSEAPYATLNFSRAVGDRAECVAENVARAALELGVPKDRVYYLSQVHGAVTHVLTGTETPEGVLALEGDALVSRVPTVACAVRSADCVPVLVADRRSGAVAAIHAGWRGVVRGAVEAGVAALRELTGEEGELVAAIGPHIRAEAFEVSEDVARELEAASPVGAVVERGGPKPHVSLARIVSGKLHALGLAASAVDDVGGCTVSEPGRFFSFRRDGKIGGRHLSAIVPRRA
ncbi:MAG TPA: peptidoglycan editing factor PgeF [Polyangiaceae bacterium]|nr:peptidoglycan editing factor PgeF [Polyangiaceae bacterium]